MSNLIQHQTYQHQGIDLDTPTGVVIRDNPGTVSVSTQDGVQTTEHKGQDKGRVSELNPHHQDGTIFATAQHPKGLPVLGITDGTLLTHEGVQAPASFWAQQGVISRAPDGSYTVAEGGPAEAPEAEVNEADFVHIHPDNLAEIQQTLAGVDESVVNGLLAVGVGVASGKLDPSALEQHWTQATGQHGEDSKLGRMQAILQHQADRAAQKAGIGADDLSHFYEWAKTQHQGQLSDALSKLVYTANATGFRALGQRYMANNAPSVEALQRAGLPMRKSSHGAAGHEVFIAKNGAGWMSLQAAARAGLV